MGADEVVERAELLLALRQRGILDRKVMTAFERVPRDRFVDPAFRDLAWVDQALPIQCGQTISQPTLVARITQALDVQPEHTVLEIGTGTGYHAAILAQIARSVVTIERFRTLADAAALKLRELELTNVEVLVADGLAGFTARAPFDRIVLNAAIEQIPEALFDQLAVDGILIAPVGPAEARQTLTRFTREEGGMRRQELGGVRFVPALAGIASNL